MKKWYEQLFENYANTYEKEVYTQGTLAECDFIEKEISHNKSLKILDIGCGTGRHSIELSKRGYNLTGIDLSSCMIESAKKKAGSLSLNIDFRVLDARNLPFKEEFDLAIMLCEGGFSLMETDEMNFEILKNATKALNKNGKFIFTTLNGLFPLFNSVKDFYEANAKEGNSSCGNNSFDIMTFRDHNTVTFTDDLGNNKELECNERYYVPSEITWLLKSLSYKKIDLYGAKLGAFSRNDELGIKDFEMLVIAEK